MSNTQEQQKNTVDFDEMLALAKADPDSFEAKREAYIESFLTSLPDEKQARLRGLQWQIDQKRQLARTPMASCLAISNLMWNSLHLLREQQSDLVKMSKGETPRFATIQTTSVKTTIIPFPAR